MKKQRKLGVILGCALGIIPGLILLIISILMTEGFWKSILGELSSIVIVSVSVGIISNYILENNTIEWVLKKINLKKSIEYMGVEEIIDNVNDIRYKDYFLEAKKNIDIVHVYAKTWTATNLDYIKDRLKNTQCNVRVVLLDPESSCIDAYCQLFNQDRDTLINNIEYVENLWKTAKDELGKNMKGNLRIYKCRDYQSSCLYRIDNRIVNIQHAFNGTRSTTAPILICENIGKSKGLYSHFEKSIEALVEDSIEIDLEV